MKKIYLYSLALIALFTACTNAPVKETTGSDGGPDTADTLTTKSTAAADSTLSGCYEWSTKTDTASLQIVVKGVNVSGPLAYRIYQKDRNDGTFTGEFNEGLLTGWYLFRSEGLMSVRQVIWRIQPDGQLWPATGEMKQSNDSSYFVDPAKVIFDNKQALVKVKCVM